MNIPLGLKSGAYNSIKEKGNLVNMLAETNRDGDFISVKRLDGLTLHDDSLTNPMRSNIHLNSGFKYFVSGVGLYRFATGVPVFLGVVGGSGVATIVSNSVPGDNQVMILNGEGQGYIYDSNGLVEITDVDFFPTTSVTVLNERFWCTRDNRNEIFASDVSDGTSYNPLSFISAEYKPDEVVINISKKSAMWTLGGKTMEYFQSVTDSLVPIRPVKGMGQNVGILAKSSFAEQDDYFAFLADDSTISLVKGTDIKTISDLEFELKIRGDGTVQNPGLTASEIASCIGFFVDTPHHKMYYLSFPDVNYTWGYNVYTGLSTTRSSTNGEAWRANYSLSDQNIIYIGDRIDGSIWILDPDAKTEGGEILKATMRCPSISFTKDVFLPVIAVDMEVGVAESPSLTDPLMLVRYSKDGGKTYINHSPISLGGWGDHAKRVVLRNFGKLVRHKDFILELSVTDPVRVQFYSIDAEAEVSM